MLEQKEVLDSLAQGFSPLVTIRNIKISIPKLHQFEW